MAAATATRQEAPAAAAPAHAPRRERDTLQTEFAFELPRGYVDDEGRVHRNGTMRLATARDELKPQIDLRVKENPAYLSVVLLAQVITQLGPVTDVHTGIVERMYATDVAFLQDFYRRINSEGHTHAAVTCPLCHGSFEVDLSGGRLGES
ncbi:secreted protein [Streptomyces filamentosus NRRL 15998]|uniref:Secreted protein n=1 Tax=Streptomyces filamentosus NRRL 15998 TaxID=457431 RepID=D6APR8_STRFL|nr:secreted protein [Streptomyces filamentosus NRRL 15998]